jgi:hypothetical protein
MIWGENTGTLQIRITKAAIRRKVSCYSCDSCPISSSFPNASGGLVHGKIADRWRKHSPERDSQNPEGKGAC